MLLQTYNCWDVILVPFPFIDTNAKKRRPALVLSHAIYYEKTHQVIALMITSAQNTNHATDVTLEEFTHAGLHKPCVVRFNAFTIAGNAIVGHLGRLSQRDQDSVKQQLLTLLPLQ